MRIMKLAALLLMLAACQEAPVQHNDVDTVKVDATQGISNPDAMCPPQKT